MQILRYSPAAVPSLEDDITVTAQVARRSGVSSAELRVTEPEIEALG
jgi:hypothetical protein